MKTEASQEIAQKSIGNVARVKWTRLLTLCIIIVLLIVAACSQDVISRPVPKAVTAQLPTMASPSVGTTGGPRGELAPIVQIVRETVVVTPTPQPIPPAANNQACNRDQHNLPDEIVIGSIYPLTNSATMMHGFAMQAAANLAVKDINARGGIRNRTVRLVAYDSGSSPEQGALFAERLILFDCVAAIVGVFHSDVASAVKEVALRHHIPVIFADPYAARITADQQAEIFRIAPLQSMFIEMMGQWLAAVGDYNEDGKLHAVILTENTKYGKKRAQQAEEILPAYGIEINCFYVDLPTDDFSPIIARIVALDVLPDVVFLSLHDEAVLPLQKQLIAAGIAPERDTLLVSTSSALDSTRFWQQVPEGNYSIVLRIGPWHSTVSPLGKLLAQRLEQLFGSWPAAQAFEAYDATLLMANAIEQANSLDPDAIIQALEATDITLSAGRYRFPYGQQNRPDGVNVPTSMWHQWPDPQLLYLQYTEPNQSSSEAIVIWPPMHQTAGQPLAPALLEQRRSR